MAIAFRLNDRAPGKQPSEKSGDASLTSGSAWLPRGDRPQFWSSSGQVPVKGRFSFDQASIGFRSRSGWFSMNFWLVFDRLPIDC